jgi:hypothetical protein
MSIRNDFLTLSRNSIALRKLPNICQKLEGDTRNGSGAQGAKGNARANHTAHVWNRSLNPIPHCICIPS